MKLAVWLLAAVALVGGSSGALAAQVAQFVKTGAAPNRHRELFEVRT